MAVYAVKDGNGAIVYFDANGLGEVGNPFQPRSAESASILASLLASEGSLSSILSELQGTLDVDSSTLATETTLGNVETALGTLATEVTLAALLAAAQAGNKAPAGQAVALLTTAASGDTEIVAAATGTYVIDMITLYPDPAAAVTVQLKSAGVVKFETRFAAADEVPLHMNAELLCEAAGNIAVNVSTADPVRAVIAYHEES